MRSIQRNGWGTLTAQVSCFSGGHAGLIGCVCTACRAAACKTPGNKPSDEAKVCCRAQATLRAVCAGPAVWSWRRQPLLQGRRVHASSRVERRGAAGLLERPLPACLPAYSLWRSSSATAPWPTPAPCLRSQCCRQAAAGHFFSDFTRKAHAMRLGQGISFLLSKSASPGCMAAHESIKNLSWACVSTAPPASCMVQGPEEAETAVEALLWAQTELGCFEGNEVLNVISPPLGCAFSRGRGRRSHACTGAAPRPVTRLPACLGAAPPHALH